MSADAPALWPCCAPAVQLFCVLATQWRPRPAGGAIGLDYTAIMPTLRLMGVPRKEWTPLFEDLRVLEEAALEKMRSS